MPIIVGHVLAADRRKTYRIRAIEIEIAIVAGAVAVDADALPAAAVVDTSSTPVL